MTDSGFTMDAGDTTDAGNTTDAGTTTDGGASATSCGATAWYCVDGSGAQRTQCSQNGPSPFTSAEGLARSNCGANAMAGECPALTTSDGACKYLSGGVCYVNVYYSLTDVQRQTARNNCPGVWTNG